MNLQPLFEMQKKLDDRIIKEKGLEGHDLLDKKILALQVELGELANELPELFKFWTNKKNNYERALEEYVDSLHFILSIMIDVKATHYNNVVVKEKDITRIFIDISNNARRLLVNLENEYGNNTSMLWSFMFKDFLQLGEMLGFTWRDIEKAYFEKNKINHERQQNGY